MANFYGNDLDNSQTGGFVNYYGGNGGDFLQGDAAANEVYGGQGNDVVNGGPFLPSPAPGVRPIPLSSRPSGRPGTTTSRAARAMTLLTEPTATT